VISELTLICGRNMAAVELNEARVPSSKRGRAVEAKRALGFR
jgi:hypothetical protein